MRTRIKIFVMDEDAGKSVEHQRATSIVNEWLESNKDNIEEDPNITTLMGVRFDGGVHTIVTTAIVYKLKEGVEKATD